FGRIGRSFLKIALENSDVEIIAINDLADEKTLAYLLKYDTVYGRYNKNVKVEIQNKDENTQKFLVIDGKKILSLSERDPEKLPWEELKIDIVMEATGVFTDFEGASKHLKAGAKRVVISAPAKGEIKHLLIGTSDQEFKTKTDKITSNGSCTTNAVSPVMKILTEKVGVKKAILNTIHSYTSSQNLVDGPHKKLNRGRAAAHNMVPTTTGAALVVSKVINDLEKKFDGIAVRVPTICGSLADITFVSGRETSVEEINNIFKEAEKEEKWQNILKTTVEPIVSSDIIQDSYAAIVDLSFTKVVGGDLVKILVWYDNEWGYCATLLEHLIRVCQIL
ncbi:MAG TPA: aldehyde dehydrogenase, partial [Bacteroidetes bacterium]|nr:aldehyde dehydrogenase [Bacteroidota bacterium]